MGRTTSTLGYLHSYKLRLIPFAKASYQSQQLLHQQLMLLSTFSNLLFCYTYYLIPNVAHNPKNCMAKSALKWFHTLFQITYKGQWILRVCSGNIKHCSNVKTVPSRVFFQSCVTLETKDFNRNLPRSGLIRQKTLMFPLSSWIVLCSTLLSVSYPRSFAWNKPRIIRVAAGSSKLGFSDVFGVDQRWSTLMLQH